MPILMPILRSKKGICPSPLLSVNLVMLSPTELLHCTMGGHDDEEMSYVVNNQRQDEDLKNKLNDSSSSSHWGDQESTGNNAKWVKDGQNQLRKVAEKHQDPDHNCNFNQNGNEGEFPHQNTSQVEEQGNEELTKSPKAVRCLGLNEEEEAKNILNEPLLIDTLESPGDKEEDEEDDKEKEEKCEEDEDGLNPTRGEKESGQDDVEPQREGAGGGTRSACLLFSSVNGTPSDEETNWPALSQESTVDGSPNGNKGKWVAEGFVETGCDRNV